MERLATLTIVLLTIVPVGCRLDAIFLSQRGLTAPTPPRQPTEGPGSSDYLHNRVTHVFVRGGTHAYHLFEPDDPKPETAPVVAFLHAYGVIHPRTYRAWINHIVRRGNIVVYPVYQTTRLTPSAAYTSGAVEALVDAYKLLRSEGHVQPHPEHLAVVGHSIGGVLAANLAASAEGVGLPAPHVVMLANAGDVRGTLSVYLFQTILQDVDYEAIPAEALMLGVIGDRDNIVPGEAPIAIFRDTPQIPLENKQILVLHSDDYGSPPLRASHTAAASVTFLRTFVSDRPARQRARNDSADAMDYYGYWKWLDALTDAAFYGLHREYALGGTIEQTYMGTWSDDTPVRAAEVIFP